MVGEMTELLRDDVELVTKFLEFFLLVLEDVVEGSAFTGSSKVRVISESRGTGCSGVGIR